MSYSQLPIVIPTWRFQRVPKGIDLAARKKRSRAEDSLCSSTVCVITFHIPSPCHSPMGFATISLGVRCDPDISVGPSGFPFHSSLIPLGSVRSTEHD